MLFCSLLVISSALVTSMLPFLPEHGKTIFLGKNFVKK